MSIKHIILIVELSNKQYCTLRRPVYKKKNLRKKDKYHCPAGVIERKKKDSITILEKDIWLFCGCNKPQILFGRRDYTLSTVHVMCNCAPTRLQRMDPLKISQKECKGSMIFPPSVR